MHLWQTIDELREKVEAYESDERKSVMLECANGVRHDSELRRRLKQELQARLFETQTKRGP